MSFKLYFVSIPTMGFNGLIRTVRRFPNLQEIVGKKIIDNYSR